MTQVLLLVHNAGAQLQLILEPLYYTSKRLGDTEKVISWKSKGLSAEKVTTPTATDNTLSSSIEWYENSNFSLIFKGSYLKKNKKPAIFTPPKKYFFYSL